MINTICRQLVLESPIGDRKSDTAIESQKSVEVYLYYVQDKKDIGRRGRKVA